MSADRQEKATEQRKRKAREHGDIPVSRDLISAAVLLCALLVLPSACVQFVRLWRGAVETSLSAASTPFATPAELVRACMTPFGPSLLPIVVLLAAVVASAACLGVAQTGGVQLHGQAIAWRMERISPAAHVKQIFGMRAWLRLAKSMVPALGVLWLGRHALLAHMMTVPFLTVERVPLAFSASYDLALAAAWIALAWSGLDYAMERRSWSQKLRMSKQDIRDEMRESNGNPQIKGRIRQVQRAMRRRRMKADVAQATVVITNPTHYAVALSFDRSTLAAPRVLCKGRDLHAFAIREEARWAGVPIVENPPLARSLYRSVDEGQAIPFELYTAVAAILAYLMRRESAPARSPETQTHSQETR